MNFGKKLLIISITGLVILTVGYFISHAVEMSKSVDFDSLVDKTFHSSNKDYQLKIISDSEIRYFNKEDYFSVRSFDYSDNFLSFTYDNEDYSFYAFDSNRLFFQNKSIYLLHQEVISNV